MRGVDGLHLNRLQLRDNVLAVWTGWVKLVPNMILPELVCFVSPTALLVFVFLARFAHVKRDKIRCPYCEADGAVFKVRNIDAANSPDKDCSIGAQAVGPRHQGAIPR